ncbi:single-strand DNA-binding protein [Nonomuraea thailandensis]|uniref:Single-strand DNA-binding protein n=1 Tax=Nonomuraea thailandensis TaxID=1188745 RepID=A0A9X2GGX4_9ACTN|nr:single-stranded DNA-binding protein [Nonomuraea thailandensis]MCP2355171.1 single-strand DNA-binding protein [Nonomuraea thailandensis]
MDRNEVLLVGRLSAPAEERSLPSGDTLTKWRIIVRRRRHRRGATLTDSVPCITFDPETAAVVRGLKPRDYVAVTGSFRCRVYGPSAGKTWRYEVEVSTAKPCEGELSELSEPPRLPEPALPATGTDPAPLAALVPRQVLYLAPTG